MTMELRSVPPEQIPTPPPHHAPDFTELNPELQVGKPRHSIGIGHF